MPTYVDYSDTSLRTTIFNWFHSPIPTLIILRYHTYPLSLPDGKHKYEVFRSNNYNVIVVLWCSLRNIRSWAYDLRALGMYGMLCWTAVLVVVVPGTIVVAYLLFLWLPSGTWHTCTKCCKIPAAASRSCRWRAAACLNRAKKNCVFLWYDIITGTKKQDMLILQRIILRSTNTLFNTWYFEVWICQPKTCKLRIIHIVLV